MEKREKDFNLIGLPGPIEDFCSYIGWSILCTSIMCGMLTVVKKIRSINSNKRKEKK